MNTIDAKTLQLAREVARHQVRLMGEPEPEPAPRSEWMFDVEVKRKQAETGQLPWRFTVKPVSDVKKGEEYRCQYCQCAVRLFQNRPQAEWHAEHREHSDAERCPGITVVAAKPA